MAETMQDNSKAILYATVYVKALAGAAEEMCGILNEPDARISEPKSFGKLRTTVAGMLSLGEDSTPLQIRESLEQLQSVSEQTVQELKEAGMEKGSMHMLFAKGLTEFVKSREAAFTRFTQDSLHPEQPLKEQALENRMAGRQKVSLNNLEKETMGPAREKHERVHVAAENAGPSKNACMGKR